MSTIVQAALAASLTIPCAATEQVRLTYEVTSNPDAAEQALTLIEQRLELHGLPASKVVLVDGQIVVTVPVEGEANVDEAKRAITNTGVEFRGVPKGTQAEAAEARLRAALEAGEEIDDDKRVALGYQDGDTRYVWMKWMEEPQEGQLAYLLVQDPAPFGTSDLERVFPDVDARGYQALGFSVRPQRVGDFREFTQGLMDRRLAIILNGRVQSAPLIRGAIAERGIIMGGATGFTSEELKRLSGTLRLGPLPVGLDLLSEELTQSRDGR